MIILVSTTLFVIMNLVENLVYYNIGKHTTEPSGVFKWSFDLPSKDDIIKIATAIILFSVIHVSLSCLFVGCRLPFNVKKIYVLKNKA